MKKYLALFSLVLALVAPHAYGATKPVPAKTPVDKPSTKIASDFFAQVEVFRIATSASIEAEKVSTKKEIQDLDALSKTKKNVAESKPLDGIEQPIAYIKLFLLSLAGFIFATQIAFYAACLVVIFFIFRFFFRKVRTR